MDLYDDLDTKQRAGQVDGWSSGIKLFQTQLALKKNTPIPPKLGLAKRSSILAPVIAFKARKDNDIDDIFKGSTTIINTNSTKTSSSLINPMTQILPPPTQLTLPIQSPLSVQSTSTSSKAFNDYDWDVIDEYDPLWPNEYEKLVKEKREKDEKPRDRSNRNDDRKRRGTRFQDDQSPPSKYSASSASSTTTSSGFCARPASMDDDEDTYSRSSPPPQSSGSSASGSSTNRVSGAAIAPPPSLQDNTQSYTLINDAKVPTNITAPYGSSSVAAKIMAKYGFKDGQGLGKQEQGMSIALQVEKTSKRGGRIIHEKELMPAPSLSPPLSTQSQQQQQAQSPPHQQQPQPNSPGSTSQQMKNEPTITEIMKAPSKVVLLRNMVGPGDVDSELEPEVKDECNTKYGEVVSVIINELTNVPAEEAVRIFVEFKRIESAIKAVVDLNGRFFGGRQVKAGFFSFDRYKMYDLTDN